MLAVLQLLGDAWVLIVMVFLFLSATRQLSTITPSRGTAADDQMKKHSAINVARRRVRHGFTS